MRENFDRSLQRVLVHEGGWSNDPQDPGGPTMRGVIQRVYDGYRRNHGLALQSVRNISLNELRDIYRTLYADKVRFDDLPKGVDYVVFDGAVNSGPTQSTKWIQRAVGCNTVDGNMGPSTIALIRAYPDHDELIAKALSLRLGMLQNLKTYKRFGAGWRKRVVDCLRGGQAWASGSVPSRAETAAAEQGARMKAAKQDAAIPLGVDEAPIVAGGGTGITPTLEITRQQLEPLAWSGGEIIQWILIGLTALCAAITIGAFVYTWWSKKKQKKANAAMNAGVYADIYGLEEVQAS